MILAEGSTRSRPGRELIQPWVRRGLQTLAAVLLLDWLLTVLPLGGAPTEAVLIVLGVVLVATILLWTRLLKWHSRIEGELRTELRSPST